MALSTKYNPAEVEDKWYQYWMDQGYFHSKPNPNKEPYTIVIPPPNVTGVLHMGHMLNNTIQDVLVRKARMEGKEACWVPGTDHASIATEAKVVAMLKDKGIEKRSISREEFVQHAWDWTHKYGGIIFEQLKKLGASLDWDRQRFTMEPKLYQSVIKVFVDLYNKGHIYRGYRMVNWDPEGRTAVADDEVNYKEVQSKLYYVNYQIDGEDGHVTIATTRPETILGDTAVCINPNDERYRHLKGKRVLVPLVNRSIPIIEDEYVTMEFGTGCLKVTPAHDINDYELGKKHNLETIDILNEDGTLSEAAQRYIGEDRFVVRKKIARELKAEGFINKIEDYMNNVGFSERTDAVIEPRLSIQWFVSMKKLIEPAYQNVMDDTVQLIPPKFKNSYKHWMENVRDWCISRQLWWGHQIPAYYLNNGDIIVAETPEEALKMAREHTGSDHLTMDDLRQEEDVLDTWFSSGLWPITVFDGILEPENEEINYYYPTNDLVTAPEILFFWVARMILYGYEYRKDKPFKNVYLTGIVRDKKGRKMSKSLGNSPDPIELMKQYGADGVRTGMLFSSPAGNDLLFDIKLCEQGRNFANKIWNAFRLVKTWELDDNKTRSADDDLAINWFKSRFSEVLIEVEDHFEKFRISDALLSIYKLIWDDFCSWYLEMVKPAYGDPIARPTYEATLELFDAIMRLLHPFMPFISEEIWQELTKRKANDSIMISAWPERDKVDEHLLSEMSMAFEIIQNIRNARNAKNISPKEALDIQIKAVQADLYKRIGGIITKQANLSSIDLVEEKPSNSVGFVLKADEFFILMDGNLDVEAECSKLEKELEYSRGFLASIDKKLSNERFVNNAPEKVVATEKKKKADAEAKIKAIEENLTNLGCHQQ